MKFSIPVLLGILAGSVSAADELTTFSLVISRGDAFFTKVITSTVGVANEYAAQYHGDNDGNMAYTVGDAAGSASFFGNSALTAAETTAAETTVPETTVSETTVPETTVPETTVPETSAVETSPATDVASSSAAASPASVASYEGGAVVNCLSFGAIGAAVAAFLV